MKKFIALDFETDLIDEGKGVFYPKPICLSWCDSLGVTKIAGNNLVDGIPELEISLKKILEFSIKTKTPLVWHNGYGFDLGVIWFNIPSCRDLLIKCLDDDLIKDTLIRERLYDLSTSGYIKQKKGSYSLTSLVKKHLGADISTYKTGDDVWRLRYKELDSIPVELYPKPALDYALMDVQLLMKVYRAQEKIRAPHGYGSMNTESVHIKSGFVLGLMTRRGLKVDIEKLDEFEKSLDAKLIPMKLRLIELGFARIDKKERFIKENKKFIDYLTNTYPDYIQRTEPTKTHPEGQIRIDEEALSDFPKDEVIDLRKDMSLLEKYKNTYCKKIRSSGGVFRGKYDVLKETGRTSGFIQTMPRQGGIRELFEARAGYKLLAVDFSALEACSAAQTIINLGEPSQLGVLLNSGESPIDFHSYVGHLWEAKAMGFRPDFQSFLDRYDKGDSSAKFYRSGAKPFNLSLFGGVGKEKAHIISKKQGVKISFDQSCEIYDMVFEVYPELQWYRKWVSGQKLSGNFEKAFAYEVNGRYRNNCTYCACANGKAMQSLAADGAKEAIWECFKYAKDKGIYLIAFIHDEILFEIPEKDIRTAPSKLSELMCRGMKNCLPDIRVTTEYSIMDCWTKDPFNHTIIGKQWID